MASSILPGVIRTSVPAIVGWALGFPAAQALGLTEQMITPLVSAFVGIVYYIAVRLLEQYVPQLGWLLGYASAPTYAPPALKPSGDQGGADVPTVLIALACAIVVVAVAAGLGWI